MKFYDFMTLVWICIWAPIAGVIVYGLASSDPTRAWELGGVATVGMALAVFFIREFNRK